MSKRLLRIALFLEIIAGVLLYIATKELIAPLLLVVSGFLFLITSVFYSDSE